MKRSIYIYCIAFLVSCRSRKFGNVAVKATVAKSKWQTPQTCSITTKFAGSCCRKLSKAVCVCVCECECVLQTSTDQLQLFSSRHVTATEWSRLRSIAHERVDSSSWVRAASHWRTSIVDTRRGWTRHKVASRENNVKGNDDAARMN